MKRKTNVLSVLLRALTSYELDLTRQFMKSQDSRYADRSGKADRKYERDKRDIVIARRRIIEEFEQDA